MVIDIALGLVFFVSAFTLWYRISRHLPELVEIPAEAIRSRLREDGARLRRFFVRLANATSGALWNFIGKTVWRLHITLLRTDNLTLTLLRRIRTQTNFANGNPSAGERPAESIPGPQVKIREVRTRKQRVAADSLGRR